MQAAAEEVVVCNFVLCVPQPHSHQQIHARGGVLLGTHNITPSLRRPQHPPAAALWALKQLCISQAHSPAHDKFPSFQIPTTGFRCMINLHQHSTPGTSFKHTRHFQHLPIAPGKCFSQSAVLSYNHGCADANCAQILADENSGSQIKPVCSFFIDKPNFLLYHPMQKFACKIFLFIVHCTQWLFLWLERLPWYIIIVENIMYLYSKRLLT